MWTRISQIDCNVLMRSQLRNEGQNGMIQEAVLRGDYVAVDFNS